MNTNKNIKLGKALILIIGGLMIGIANGLFGGGGGMICVPLLLLMKLDNQKAQATAVLIMAVISIASMFVYYSNGFVDISIALYLVIGSIIGGIFGALLLKKFSNQVLQYIFAIIMLVAGIRLLF